MSATSAAAPSLWPVAAPMASICWYASLRSVAADWTITGTPKPVQAVGELARTFARGEHEIGPVLRDGFDVRLEAGKLSHRRLGRKV